MITPVTRWNYLVLVVLFSSSAFAQVPAAAANGLGHTSVLSDRAARRILEQATWGPTQIGSPVLLYKGFEPWFESQLTVPSSTYTDQPLLNADGKTNTNVAPT